MTDLISRTAALEALRQISARPSSIDAIEALPAITPKVVANISGGILQGASSDYPVDIYTLDFDVDSFDDKATGIYVEGSRAYRHGEAAAVDPDFVTEVLDAEEIYFHNGEPVDE